LYDLIDTTTAPVGEPDCVGSPRDDLPFHTDNAWGRIFPDYVGLLCLRSARSGGNVQLVSAHTLIERLREASPRSVEALQAPVTFDRTRQIQPGEDAFPSIRVLAWRDSRELTFRYLHYQIAQHTLSGQQRSAIAALESTLRRPALRMRLSLQAGEILLLNNHWVLHNRTRYDNGARPRWHVRLWLARPARGSKGGS
jgi:alpha-ketoglutarate-dependent taurine dioxygenase